MKANLIYKTKHEHGKGFVEIVIWEVPKPVPPSEHAFKYRLVYIVDGQRVVGYDNERGKGDHKHFGENEYPYKWISPSQLMKDFMSDVESLL
jgi:hypothetical protein